MKKPYEQFGFTPIIAEKDDLSDSSEPQTQRQNVQRAELQPEVHPAAEVRYLRDLLAPRPRTSPSSNSEAADVLAGMAGATFCHLHVKLEQRWKQRCLEISTALIDIMRQTMYICGHLHVLRVHCAHLFPRLQQFGTKSLHARSL